MKIEYFPWKKEIQWIGFSSWWPSLSVLVGCSFSALPLLSWFRCTCAAIDVAMKVAMEVLIISKQCGRRLLWQVPAWHRGPSVVNVINRYHRWRHLLPHQVQLIQNHIENLKIFIVSVRYWTTSYYGDNKDANFFLSRHTSISVYLLSWGSMHGLSTS